MLKARGSYSIKGKEREYSPVLEEGWRTQVCISSDRGVPGRLCEYLARGVAWFIPLFLFFKFVSVLTGRAGVLKEDGCRGLSVPNSGLGPPAECSSQSAAQ